MNIISKLKLSKKSIDQVKNILYSAFFKLLGISLNLMLVPITLNYLDSNNYGVWLTISSILSWISLLDMGIGNGLKNKLTENLAKEDTIKSKSIVSTSYFIFTFIIVLFIIVFLILNSYINWELYLNIKLTDSVGLNKIMPILITFFSIRFVLDLINSILYAYQRADLVAKNNFIINALVFIGVYSLSKFNLSNKLLWLNIMSNGLPILFLLIISIYYFRGVYKNISPALKKIQIEQSSELLSVGLKFFFIQISGIIIFSTDNIIITSIFSPKEVTIYNIPYKLFSIFIFGWTVIMTPLWTAFGEAYIKKEFDWIEKVVSYLNKLWIILFLCVSILILFSAKIYSIWLGDSVQIPFNLTLFMGVFVLISTYGNIYIYFINGVGKLKLQLYTSLFAAIINIPLCLLMTKVLGFGVEGIIIATCLSISIYPVLAYFQYIKIIKNKATGIWLS